MERAVDAVLEAELVALMGASALATLVGLWCGFTSPSAPPPSNPKKAAPPPAPPAAAPAAPKSSDGGKSVLAKLVHRQSVSRDTVLLEFDLPSSHPVNLPVGKHIKVFAPNISFGHALWNGQANLEHTHARIERKYTPCTLTRTGFVLVVKVYSAGGTSFTHGGRMTQHLASLAVGDDLECALPFGLIEYLGQGKFRKSRSTEHQARVVGMVAGGSGITPMLRLLEHALHNENDGDSATEFRLLFANRDEGDIILKRRLDELHARFPHKFKLQYILSQPSKEWQGLRGYINKQILEDFFPAARDGSTLMLVCGPPKMINTCVKPHLLDMYAHSHVWDF